MANRWGNNGNSERLYFLGLRRMRGEKQKAMEMRDNSNKDVQVIVGMGTCGIAAGAKAPAPGASCVSRTGTRRDGRGLSGPVSAPSPEEPPEDATVAYCLCCDGG